MTDDRVSTVIAALAARRSSPSATYRLQFNKTFTFDDARWWLEYLHALGISHVYASPYLKANPGSMHGYDIVDHSQLNPEIGDTAAYQRFVIALHALGMKQLLDVVPNHMSTGPGNSWWLDVLENGPSSPFAIYFDIDYHPPKAEMTNKVLLPVLGDQFGLVLDRGELRLVFEDGVFTVRYYDQAFPIATDTYPLILQPALDQSIDDTEELRLELASIITAISHLPPRTETDPARLIELRRERGVVRRRLQQLCARSTTVLQAIAAVVSGLNGTPGNAASFDGLAALLEQQSYRLSFWRTATDEINYRRFFDINSLAALRMDLPEVFEATHVLILQLVREGAVDGLRIDHPDGLRDPAAYLHRLQRRYVLELCRAEAGHAFGAGAALELPNCQAAEPLAAETWAAAVVEQLVPVRTQQAAIPVAPPLYVVVEKILSHDERLPIEWPVDGTVGYECMSLLNGIFVNSANKRAFDRLYSNFIGNETSYRDLVYEAKKLIMRTMLASEINVLGLHLSRIAARNRRYRDFTLSALTQALVEVIACFPIYRTYIEPYQPYQIGSLEPAITERDLLYIDIAVTRARRRNPVTDLSIFTFIHDTVLGVPDSSTDGTAQFDDVQADFVAKFQQVCSPVMAKSVEDTTFYRYIRLLSLNEVGSDPDQFGNSVASFHRQNAERQVRLPYSLSTTSTHDTKRSEDVRARLNALSEIPDEWQVHLRRWARAGRYLKQSVRGQAYPDRNDEYLIFQTLVGAWPFALLDGGDGEDWREFHRRIRAYLQKALREAKVHTSWITQDEAYEAATLAYVDGLLDPTVGAGFQADALPFIRSVANWGCYNSLAQTLLKLTCPGVPDIYQGTELWDLSLVDPDNRRPVDFAHRQAALYEIERRTAAGTAARGVLAAELLDAKNDGRIKLFLTHRALNVRRAHPEWFGAGGAYVPLETAGSKSEHVVAFLRRGSGGTAITVVPRLIARLAKRGEPPLGSIWADTVVSLRGEPAGATYCDCFTGAVVVGEEREGRTVLSVASLFATLPFALLERIDATE